MATVPSIAELAEARAAGSPLSKSVALPCAAWHLDTSGISPGRDSPSTSPKGGLFQRSLSADMRNASPRHGARAGRGEDKTSPMAKGMGAKQRSVFNVSGTLGPTPWFKPRNGSGKGSSAGSRRQSAVSSLGSPVSDMGRRHGSRSHRVSRQFPHITASSVRQSLADLGGSFVVAASRPPPPPTFARVSKGNGSGGSGGERKRSRTMRLSRHALSALSKSGSFQPETIPEVMYETRCDKVQAEKNKKEELRSLFERYDEDGSGFIDKSELVQLIRDVGVLNVSDSDVLVLFEEVDLDKNGLIDLAEFVHFYNLITVSVHPSGKAGYQANGFDACHGRDRLRLCVDGIEDTANLVEKIQQQKKLFARDIYTTDHQLAARARIHDLLYNLSSWAPDYIWRRRWDVVVLFLMVYSVVVPTSSIVMRVHPTFPLLIADCVVSVGLLFDIFVNLNTAIEASAISFSLIVDKRDIFRAYLRRGFFIDLLSAFPFDLIAWLWTRDRQWWLIARALRPLKLLKWFQLFKMTNRGNMDPDYVRFYFWIVPTLLACAKYLQYLHFLTLGRVLVSPGGWPEQKDSCHRFGPDACAESPLGQYLYALFWLWSLLTTQGTAALETPIAYGYAGLVLVLSLLLQGLIVADMSAVVIKSSVRAQISDSMRSTLATMQHYSIPISLQQEVLSFQYHSLQQNAAASLSHTLQRLPKQMQREVGLYVKVDLVASVPMFISLSSDCKLAVANCLEQTYAEPQDHIIKYGYDGQEMFFMMHGFADVIVPAIDLESSQQPDITHIEGCIVATVRRGDFFGEVALLLKGQKRTASVQALTYCDLFQLHQADFTPLYAQFDELAHRMSAEARDRGLLTDDAAASVAMPNGTSHIGTRGSAQASMPTAPTDSGGRHSLPLTAGFAPQSSPRRSRGSVPPGPPPVLTSPRTRTSLAFCGSRTPGSPRGGAHSPGSPRGAPPPGSPRSAVPPAGSHAGSASPAGPGTAGTDMTSSHNPAPATTGTRPRPLHPHALARMAGRSASTNTDLFNMGAGGGTRVLGSKPQLIYSGSRPAGLILGPPRTPRMEGASASASASPAGPTPVDGTPQREWAIPPLRKEFGNDTTPPSAPVLPVAAASRRRSTVRVTFDGGQQSVSRMGSKISRVDSQIQSSVSRQNSAVPPPPRPTKPPETPRKSDPSPDRGDPLGALTVVSISPASVGDKPLPPPRCPQPTSAVAAGPPPPPPPRAGRDDGVGDHSTPIEDFSATPPPRPLPATPPPAAPARAAAAIQRLEARVNGVIDQRCERVDQQVKEEAGMLIARLDRLERIVGDSVDKLGDALRHTDRFAGVLAGDRVDLEHSTFAQSRRRHPPERS